MKNIFYILILLPTSIFAQYPSNSGQKITLGEQTTADGLVYRGVASIDTVTATSKITRANKQDTSAYILLDTVTNLLWHYKIGSNAWTQAGGGVSVSSFSAGTTGLTPSSATTGAVTLGGTLAVANGGTNRTTMPDGYILHGDGTSVDTSVNLFWDRTNSRLGIGTNTPAQKLEISTPSFLTRFLITNTENGWAGAGFQLRVLNGGTTVSDATVRVDNDYNINFFIGADQVMNITKTKRLGLMTASPTEALHVVGNARITENIGAGIDVAQARLHVKGSGVTNSSTALKVDNSGNTNLLTVLDNGNVGIGTSSPGASLHVAGAISSTPTGSGFLAGIQGNYGVAHLNGSDGGLIDFSISGTDTRGRIIYTNSNNEMGFGTTNGVTKMTLDANGNLGIGVTTLSARLSVKSIESAARGITILGRSDDIGTIRFFNAAGTSEQGSMISTATSFGFMYNDVSRLSFAASTGAATFSSTIEAARYLANSSSASLVAFGVSAGNGMYNAGTNVVAFSTASTERMRITSGGNVGIGTASPTARLQVKGSGVTTGETFKIENSGGTNLLTVLDNGSMTLNTPLSVENGGTGQTTKTAALNALLPAQSQSTTIGATLKSNGTNSYWDNFSASGLVQDQSGNFYNTVAIGTQVWFKENLRTKKYRSGALIPVITNTDTSTIVGQMYYYNNDSLTNYSVYGALYNWKATQNSDSLCPTGWHVPTDAEWTTLTTYLGGESVAGGKMKSVGTAYWNSPNTDATNESGFSGLPGGYRDGVGSFGYVRDYAIFWSATENDDYGSAWYRNLYYYSSNVNRYLIYSNSKSVGASVRCLKN